MSYILSLRQQANWIREAIDPDFDPLMKITLDDIDVEELDEAANYIVVLERALRWMVNNPGARPTNVVAIAADALSYDSPESSGVRALK